MVLTFQTLSFLPAPQKPQELLEELDPLPPPNPRDGFLAARPLLSDGADEDAYRRVRVESEGFGVPSLESRRSFFSENFPDVSSNENHPPNRILHNFHIARMDKMLKAPIDT